MKKVKQQAVEMTAQEVREIRACHKETSPGLLKRLEDMSRAELTKFALSEMRCKNDVYYFILESGLLQMYIDYTYGTKSTVTA